MNNYLNDLLLGKEQQQDLPLKWVQQVNEAGKLEIKVSDSIDKVRGLGILRIPFTNHVSDPIHRKDITEAMVTYIREATSLMYDKAAAFAAEHHLPGATILVPSAAYLDTSLAQISATLESIMGNGEGSEYLNGEEVDIDLTTGEMGDRWVELIVFYSVMVQPHPLSETECTSVDLFYSFVPYVRGEVNGEPGYVAAGMPFNLFKKYEK